MSTKPENSIASLSSSFCVVPRGTQCVFGQSQVEAGALRPGAPVVDIVGEGLLPQVEIDGGDALAEIQERDGDVHGDGGLPGASLLVAEHNDMRGGWLA